MRDAYRVHIPFRKNTESDIVIRVQGAGGTTFIHIPNYPESIDALQDSEIERVHEDVQTKPGVYRLERSSFTYDPSGKIPMSPEAGQLFDDTA